MQLLSNHYVEKQRLCDFDHKQSNSHFFHISINCSIICGCCLRPFLSLQKKSMLANTELECDNCTWPIAPAIIHSATFESQKILHWCQFIYDKKPSELTLLLLGKRFYVCNVQLTLQPEDWTLINILYGVHQLVIDQF